MARISLPETNFPFILYKRDKILRSPDKLGTHSIRPHSSFKGTTA